MITKILAGGRLGPESSRILRADSILPKELTILMDAVGAMVQ